MSRAVIGPGAVCRCYAQLCRVSRDRQITLGLADRVVLRKRAFLQRVAERILYRARCRDRAGEFVSSAFAAYPAGLYRQAISILAFNFRVRQRTAVVFPALAAARQSYSLRIDRQRTRDIRNNIIGRNAGNSRLFSLSQILLGALADIGDRRSRAERGFDSRTVALQRAFNGVSTIQRRAVVGLAVGLGLDRQRQRIVNDDRVPVDRHSDRRDWLGRQSIALIRRIECGCGLGSVAFTDGDVFRHIIRDRGRGALQVVVNRNFRLVQLEVRIVGVRLIDAVVLAGNERGCLAHMLCAIIASPVVDNVRVGTGSSRRAGSRSGRRLDRLGRGSDSTPAGAVGSDRVVDGYIVLFPHSKQIFIGLLFVSCNMCRCRAARSGVLRTVPHEEVRSRTALGLGPALEGITRTGRSGQDINSLVDLDAGVGIIELALAIVLTAVVAVPVDVRRGLYFLVLIDSLQLDGVVVVAGFNHIAGSNNTALLVRDLGIGLQCRKGPAGNDRSVGVFECAAIPGLQHPVVEDLACGCSGSCAGGDIGVVLVKCSVAGRIGSVARVIEDADALCADRDRAPLAIEVELLGDPETIDVRVGRGAVAPPVHGIREVRGLVIGRTAADLRVLSKRARGADISVPAVELIALAHSGGDRNLTTVGNAEVHRLIIGAPIQRGIRARVRVQEYTVLDLTPLGIDREAAVRHRREGIGMRAELVDIPAFKNVSLGCGRLIVIRAGRVAVHLVVGLQIRVVRDVVDYMQLAAAGLARDPVPVAVIIRAVHEVQRIDITGIVTIDRASTAASPGVARGVAELGEAYEIKIVLFLGEVTVVRGHFLMQDKSLSVVGRIRCLPGKCLDIVIDMFGIVGRLIQMERNALGGHDVDVD